MANNIGMGFTDPLGLQTPEQQVQAFFVAQVGRDLEHFKEWVVYYGFHYEIEAAKLEEKFFLKQAQLEGTEHVLPDFAQFVDNSVKIKLTETQE